jgi:hypothetical protein
MGLIVLHTLSILREAGTRCPVTSFFDERPASAGEIDLRDQLSPALADQLEVRRERAGLEEKLGELNVSLGDPAAGRECLERALRLRRALHWADLLRPLRGEIRNSATPEPSAKA